MKDFADKTFVVTGAGSGIGRALARRLDAEGAHLALADWDSKSLRETTALLSGADVLADKLDVADRAAVYGFKDKVIAHFGHVDAVINNAGAAHSQTVAEVTYEDFEWIVGVNFWGVVHGTKAFLPELLERPEASLVNISSIFGMIAVPSQGTYNATKFAVRGFTEALRLELEDTDLHVMCVHPGGIKTNIARNARFYTGPEGESHEEGIRQFDMVARTSPEQAADRILKGLRRREKRCLIGKDAVAIDWIQRLLPVRYWSLIKKLFYPQAGSATAPR